MVLAPILVGVTLGTLVALVIVLVTGRRGQQIARAETLLEHSARLLSQARRTKERAELIRTAIATLNTVVNSCGLRDRDREYAAALANLGVAHSMLGSVEDRELNLRNSIIHFAQAARTRLAERSPGFRYSVLVDLGSSYGQLSDVRAGHRASAMLLHKAIGSFQQAASTRPASPEAHYGLGIALSRLAQTQSGDEVLATLDKAVESLRTCTKLDPDNPTALERLGAVLGAVASLRTGDAARMALDEAVRALSRAISLDEKFYDGLNTWGVVLGRYASAHPGPGAVEMLQTAAAKLRTALEVHPSSVSARKNLGVALGFLARLEPKVESRAHLDEALQAFRSALRQRPDDAELTGELADTLRDMAPMQDNAEAESAMYEEAVEAYRRAVGLDTAVPGFYCRWATLLTAMAKTSPPEKAQALLRDALSKYDQAAALPPLCPKILSNKANTLVALWRLATPPEKPALIQQTQQLLEECERLSPGSCTYDLACVAALTGQNDRAFALLEKALVGGGASVEHAEQDEDLAGLKGDARLRSLLDKYRTPSQGN